MHTTAELRELWSPACKRELTTISFHSGAKVSIAVETVAAWMAFDAVLQQFAYEPRPRETGGYNCRAITGGTEPSLHSYGIAVDVNTSTNPYRRDRVLVTDMPTAMTDAIKALRTNKGDAIFRWGGDYTHAKDAMHWEVVLSPAELAAGIAGGAPAAPLTPAAIVAAPAPKSVKKGARGDLVTELQQLLKAIGLLAAEATGIFGDETDAAVRAYQTSRQLDVDGIAGRQTFTALRNQQPVVERADSPVKIWTRTRSSPSDFPLLKRGDEGPAVCELQQRIMDVHLDIGGVVTGTFGPKTDAAVRAYQTTKSLNPDGKVGTDTWTALLAEQAAEEVAAGVAPRAIRPPRPLRLPELHEAILDALRAANASRTELAERIGATRRRVGRVVEELVALGLVKADRRSVTRL